MENNNQDGNVDFTLDLTDMSVKEQLTELESFQVKLVKDLDKLKMSSDHKVKMEAVRTIATLIKNIQTSLQKQRELEMKEEIDFTSAKARRAMLMLIEVFFQAMDEAMVDEAVSENVKSILQVKLMGFEEKITKELKGISGELLEEVRNPLL